MLGRNRFCRFKGHSGRRMFDAAWFPPSAVPLSGTIRIFGSPWESGICGRICDLILTDRWTTFTDLVFADRACERAFTVIIF
jgi:hypothetical protein